MAAEEETTVTQTYEQREQFASLRNVLERGSAKLCPPLFEAGDINWEELAEAKILVIGAGGLGCELLKDLALSGLKDITVVDLDTIEVSNLNRQFLFRKKDVGSPKSKCAAEFVMKRVPGCKVAFENRPIQEFDADFYSQFRVVIAGLDNIKARRWINAQLFSMVEYEDGQPDINSIIPLIDGGTEGFKGHVRVFVPGLSSCFECSLQALPPATGYALCTLQGKPRKPEHCVAYAHKLQWPKLKFLNGLEEGQWELCDDKNEGAGLVFDSDDPTHMSWMYHRALERAEQFGIEGVDYNMTMQVTKNIIPAIASTNALVSAACVAECFKILTYSSMGLDNWLMYMGQNGCYTRTMQYKQEESCIICGKPYPINTDPSVTLEAFMKQIKSVHNLASPALTTTINDKNKTLWIDNDFLKAKLIPNLKKSLGELLEGNSGQYVICSDKSLGAKSVTYQVEFVEGQFWSDPAAEEN